jgi:phosphonate transport system substrate-binding protein
LKKWPFVPIALIGSLFAISGCSSNAEEGPIRVAGLPFDDTQNISESYEIFMELVAEATGREVVFFETSDYAATTEAVVSGQVDIAQLSAFNYVLATSRTDELQILGISTRDPGSAPGTYAYAIKRTGDDSINSIQDLAGKKVCFSDPSSGIGYLWPAKFLAEAGLDPDPLETKDFEPVFAGTFPQVALSVELGDCDAGFLLDVFWDKTLPNSDTVDITQLEKFWESTVSPGIPLVLNPSRLSADEIQKLEQMIEEKANKDFLVTTGICEDFASCKFLSAAAWGYVPGEDGFYDELRGLCDLLDLDQCRE